MGNRNYRLIIITNVIDGWRYRFEGGNADNRLLRFIAFGAIMSVVLIRYMLGFAGRMT